MHVLSLTGERWCRVPSEGVSMILWLGKSPDDVSSPEMIAIPDGARSVSFESGEEVLLLPLPPGEYSTGLGCPLSNMCSLVASSCLFLSITGQSLLAVREKRHTCTIYTGSDALIHSWS